MNMTNAESIPDDIIDRLTYPAEGVIRRTFTIEQPFLDYVSALGGGNASRGLRIAILSCAKWQALEKEGKSGRGKEIRPVDCSG